MAMLSDGARYAWPWFWCASNTVGRVKLAYRDFLNTVFRQFKKVPTEDQFWDWVAQYHECFLMFVYQSEGAVWGHWHVSERYLPQYKLKADSTTPAPDAKSFLEWTNKYARRKSDSVAGKCRVLSVSENFQNISEDFALFEKSSMERRGEEGIKPSSPTPSAKRANFEEWWKVWWNKTAKVKAQKAWTRTASRFGAQFLIDAAVADRLRFEGTPQWEWRANLNPATWLNGERWLDQLPPEVVSTAKNGVGPRQRRLEPEPATESQQREDLEFLAANDLDPVVREQARKKLQ